LQTKKNSAENSIILFAPEERPVYRKIKLRMLGSARSLLKTNKYQESLKLFGFSNRTLLPSAFANEKKLGRKFNNPICFRGASCL
jgi:hypothetical protein